ncbi:MAG: acyl-CoA dehydrogenase family protein [Myxococcales bacterium]|nr:acyl-CoA dehydrogenase family protein [Myxococcales bacterium]
MISFEPTEDQRLISETVLEFAKTTLSPRAREFEKAQRVPADVRSSVQEMQLGLAAFPEEAGGQALGLLTSVIINEELALGDPAAPFGLPGFGAFPLFALELGGSRAPELLKPFTLEGEGCFGAVAWSERKALSERPGFGCVAKREGSGYELTGEKCFVGSAGLAEQFIVFAQIDESAGWEGLGAFLVPRGTAGLSVGERHRTLGLDCADFRPLKLEGVRLPSEARLVPDLIGEPFTRAVLRAFAKYSLIVAARQVGLSRSAFETAREYCDIRQAFGKPIGHFQAVAFTLADRHMDGESASALCRRAAWCWDSGRSEEECLLRTAQAVAHAHEVAMRCADDAVQLHGGAGFMRDVIVEKMMRDAKQMALVGLTAEHMDQLAANLEVRGKLDSALVLPTPETQSVFV